MHLTHLRHLSLLIITTTILSPYPSSSASPPNPLNLIPTHPLLTTTNPPTCTGSIWCPRLNLPSNSLNLYLQNWLNYTLPDTSVYAPGAQIACATVTILFPPLGTNAYCAYTKGVHGPGPAAGINGATIKKRMEQLRTAGCFACGSVAVAESGDVSEKGVFVIDYVPRRKVRCGREGEVVCPPTVPGVGDVEGKGEGPRPEFRTFNGTFDEGGITLQALNVPEA